MNIHEFQGKHIFREAGIPVPQGQVAKTPEEAEAAARALKTSKVVVKSQIHAGGRGKGTIVGNEEVRGVKVVDSPEEAREHAAALLGNVLQTHQTGPEGRTVKQVLIEEASDIAKEYYLGMVLDRDASRVSFIASTEGGMDIEKVADETPERIFKQTIDPATGMMPYHARKIAYALGFSGDTAKQATKLLTKLYHVFLDTDASLVEINPLVTTSNGDVLALDAKLNFDDNALFRHPNLTEFRDLDEEDPKEREAKDTGLSYVALDGTIGCLVNGAGLAMATMDMIKFCGGAPANFLDVGGGATAEQVTKAFSIILQDPNVNAILVNIFGGIAKCDVIAEGIVTAAQNLGLEVPLVVRLEGTNVDEGKRILADSGLKITPAGDMKDAADKVVAAAGGAA